MTGFDKQLNITGTRAARKSGGSGTLGVNRLWKMRPSPDPWWEVICWKGLTGRKVGAGQ